ncbi:MAG: aminotransferase class III-fold pyridoxal phosphate-dependent enzyme [Paracoccus sp. (in: a-proteobacteria)]|nr:aminotransferase class III-fold pyridoxal phosphate-dependent enzyme [Paracoccus sp. (in: a-proteobacteria)]
MTPGNFDKKTMLVTTGAEAAALEHLERLFGSSVEPERVAAIIIEPVQSEGGIVIAPPGFLRALRDICDRYGIVLIADEVQAGMARTGRMFGFDHAGVVPDLVVMAKGLAAVTGRADIVDAPTPAESAAPMRATRWRLRPLMRCRT